MITESTTPSVADALAAADRVHAHNAAWGSRNNAGELAALRDLADAVRGAQAGPGPSVTAPPVPGVSQVGGYLARAIVTTAGRDSAWFVAAEWVTGGRFAGRWSTWRVEASPGGTLGWSEPRFFADSADNRASALRDLAERSAIAP
jgi:hypothetical protein